MTPEQQIPTAQPTPPKPIKFSRDFAQAVYKYIEEGKDLTVIGFAVSIGVTKETVLAWANKKRKDEKGNLTEEYARPNFFSAVKKLEEIENSKKDDKLNAKQELFCQLYASDREFFGNGVQSYIEAYKPETKSPNWYKTVCSASSRLLSDVKVCKRINELLSAEGLNDEFVDKQLLYVIAQHDDRGAKVAAIREYNKLRARITEKLDHTSDGKPIKQIVGFTYVNPSSDGTNKPDNQTNA